MPKIKNCKNEKRWALATEKGFDSDWLPPAITKILANRGIKDDDEARLFLSPKYERLSDPYLIPDMAKAVDEIVNAIAKNEKVIVYGDYDVDGISATALLVDFFSKINVKADYYIPSRQDEGYGLNIEAIKKIASAGDKLVITVDCGSTSIKEIDEANKLGLKVIMTDHHETKKEDDREVLPDAVAVINPKRADSKLKEELAGVGVAFYLVRALQERLDLKAGQEKWFLDLVSLGTICDVVPLIGDNRILAYYGLKVLAKSRRIGIKTLAGLAGFELSEVDSYKIGFLIGPRLNAAGRLESALGALKLLLTDSYDEAMNLAKELDVLNQVRQEMTENILTQAREMVDKRPDNKIYFLSNADWPAGVVGIVASRLVDEYNKPFLLMEDQGEYLKGSARTIPAFNIIENISELAEYFEHFGGHAFAAGFKFKKEHFIVLEKKLLEIANQKISSKDLTAELYVDSKILIKEIDQTFLKYVRMLEPFGRMNPRPTFLIEGAKVADFRLVGSPPIHLKLSIVGQENRLGGIAFGWGEEANVELGQNIDIVCTLEENTWNGRSKAEFRVIDLK